MRCQGLFSLQHCNRFYIHKLFFNREPITPNNGFLTCLTIYPLLSFFATILSGSRCRHGFFEIVNNVYTHWEMYAIGGSAEPTINSKGNRYTAPGNPFAKDVSIYSTFPPCISLLLWVLLIFTKMRKTWGRPIEGGLLTLTLGHISLKMHQGVLLLCRPHTRAP